MYLVDALKEIPEEKRLNVRDISTEQRYLPKTFSDIYMFLRKMEGIQGKEYVEFREYAFVEDSEAGISGLQLLVTNLFIQNENIPLSRIEVMHKIGTTVEISPDVQYPLVRVGAQIRLCDELIKSQEGYKLIEGVVFYSDSEPNKFMRGYRNSRLFLGKKYSLSALKLLAEILTQSKFKDLLQQYFNRRILEISESDSVYWTTDKGGNSKKRKISLLEETLDKVKSL
jgi:hypothetical protein